MVLNIENAKKILPTYYDPSVVST